MDDKEKRQLETQLLSMGLAGLLDNGIASSELIQQIAAMVNDWQATPNRHGEWIDRHKFLRDLLAECDAVNRSEMYAAIMPHLKFKALPLATYEAMMTERMSSLVSKGAAGEEGRAPHPIEVGGKKYVKVSESQATHAVMMLYCQRCKKRERFISDTPTGAMIEARKAGWARVPFNGGPEEACHECLRKIWLNQGEANAI